MLTQSDSDEGRKATRKAARESRVRDALNRFDDMPDDGKVRLPVLCAITGIGPATVWRKARLDSTFPKPVKLSAKVTAWNVRDVRAWLASRRAP